MKRSIPFLLAMCSLALFLAFLPETSFGVAEIVVNNLDGAGEGFNDPAPFASVGGNPATTIGSARLIAFQFAAQLWGSCLNSDVVIQIDAQFDPLPCNANSAVLGAAGPNTVHQGFFNAPLAQTWYPQALANALATFDVAPVDADITATFNSDIDNNNACLNGVNWYYGLDANPPGNDIDFVSVVLHELGHGLGVSSFVDLATGAELGGLDDVYSTNLEHHGQAVPGYPAMTNAQRVAASTSDPDLHWIGPLVDAQGNATLAAGLSNGHVRMHGPAVQQPGSSVSHFSTALFPNELMEPSYTGPNHNPGLALELLQDLGWTSPPKNGVDIVFIMDVTGSTGALLPNWVNQIPTIAAAWQAFDPGARFALVSHVDFPFPPHGVAGEWAYRVETTFDPNIANLQAALGLLAQQFGNDAAESQYEAIFQVLTGSGRDLTNPVNYIDPGEIPPVPLGQLFPMVIYHFTFPELFHDRDVEPNYPFVGSKPVASRTDVLNELAIKSAQNMFFGLTFISGKTKMHRQYAQQQVGIGPLTLQQWKGGETPLTELANITGGLVLDVGESLELLLAAVDSSIVHWSGSRQGSDDSDGDGIPDIEDNCPFTFNENQSDGDGDGIGDVCDNCRAAFNPEQLDCNLNGAGDACDVSCVTSAPAGSGTTLFLAPSPNPASASTRFAFVLPEAGNVRIEVLDQRGRSVRLVTSDHFSSGQHQVTWDGRDARGVPVSSGVYWARMRTESGEEAARKVMVLR